MSVILEIVVPETTLWNDTEELFIPVKETPLQLEHSLISLSKWEAKWCKPFITAKQKSDEETRDYIQCMNLGKKVDPNVFLCLTKENIDQIDHYIDAPMSATVFSGGGSGRGPDGSQITSELIYYWMVAYNIPLACEKWHLNRLITLIRICDIKNKPAKKMSVTDVISQNAELNALRRKQQNTKG